jgi:hypothetical protein
VVKKLDLAYLAGVMDSDGSFSIGIDTWRVRTLARSPAYQEITAIAQCEPQAIQLLKELFGGCVSFQKARGPNRRPMLRWQATNKVAIGAVLKLLPFLRIKRRQAEILLALRKIKERGREKNTALTRPHIRTVKPEVLAEMDRLARQIRELNDTRFPLART